MTIKPNAQLSDGVQIMNRRVLLIAVVAVLGLMSAVRAADDPTGSWKFTATIGKKRLDGTLKLKMEGDKLTGSISQGNRDVAIMDGTFKNDKVSFSVIREQKGEKLTQKYVGTINGDTIKGTIDTERGGKSRSTDWEAKRQK
jgi:hypothetical protein